MNHYVYISITSLVLLFFGNTFSAEYKINSTPDDQEKIERFAFKAIALVGDGSMASIRKIGNLVKEETHQSDNLKNPTIKDIVKIFHFEGLEIAGQINKDNESDSLHLSHVTFTDPKWQLPQGIAVGMPVTKIYEVLGLPNSNPVDNQLLYTGTTKEVYFITEKNKISKIEIIYYTD